MFNIYASGLQIPYSLEKMLFFQDKFDYSRQISQKNTENDLWTK